MGHGADARRVLNDKFFHESRCCADEWLARQFMRIYRWGFGCGYLPMRAFATFLIWFALGWLGVSAAMEENDRNNVVLVRSATGVEIVRSLSRPEDLQRSPVFDEKRDRREGPVYASVDKVSVRDIPCTDISPALYAFDTMLPVVDLHMMEKCEMAADAPGWRFGKAIYSAIGWIITVLAALTWTGVLRRTPE